MDENVLKCIDERLDRLENVVYGHSAVDADTKCIETLMNVQNKLQSSVTGKEKITLLFNKLHELEKYLNPSFKENLTVNDSVKMNLVLLDEDRVRKTVDFLQTVKDLSQYLETEHIKGVPTLVPKLHEVIQVQKDLQEKSINLSGETRNLIADYDNLIMSISKQFILWDSMLTEIEKTKITTKVVS